MQSTTPSEFDCVIIGAGPAGGQLARVLAAASCRVLLVEQHAHFQVNNFSSAGTVASFFKDFKVPHACAGSEWRALRLVVQEEAFFWRNEEIQGAVLDFAALRQFLSEAAQARGAAVWMQHRYVGHVTHPTWLEVELEHAGAVKKVSTRFLVDASGVSLALRRNQSLKQPERVYPGVGLEYLIQTKQLCHDKDALTFFLGEAWVPQGYGWIFPMQPHVYKVGVGLLELTHKKRLKIYLEKILQDYLKLAPEDYTVLDRHGGEIKGTHLEDAEVAQGRVISVGDALFTINTLGGEGIRFAMENANMLAPFIIKALAADHFDAQAYRKAFLKRFKRRWAACLRYSHRAYLHASDAQYLKVLRFLKLLSLTQLIDILFFYRFNHLKYIALKLGSKRLWCKLIQRLQGCGK